MNRIVVLSLLILPLSFAASAEQLIPAGSVVQCMVSDKISSKTTNVGDPILCQVNHTEMYGRSVFPYGSYMVGHFEDYKDPGHFVGKGWMELKFDRIVVGNDTVIPISTRVIATSDKYPVDGQGRIHGTGHPVRDTVEWMIPILWPIDLINLPRRGPRPVLKPETRLTVRLLDDLGVPTKNEVQHLPELISRFNYSDADPAPGQQQQVQQAAPIERHAPPMEQTYQPAYQPEYQQPAAFQQAYAQPSPQVIVVQAPAPTIIQQAAPQQAPVFVNQQPAYYPAPMSYPVAVPYAYPRYYPRLYRRY